MSSSDVLKETLHLCQTVMVISVASHPPPVLFAASPHCLSTSTWRQSPMRFQLCGFFGTSNSVEEPWGSSQPQMEARYVSKPSILFLSKLISRVHLNQKQHWTRTENLWLQEIPEQREQTELAKRELEPSLLHKTFPPAKQRAKHQLKLLNQPQYFCSDSMFMSCTEKQLSCRAGRPHSAAVRSKAKWPCCHSNWELGLCMCKHMTVQPALVAFPVLKAVHWCARLSLQGCLKRVTHDAERSDAGLVSEHSFQPED